jgi:hypothetical protein
MFHGIVTALPSITMAQHAFNTRLEAKDWCADNAMYGDDVYIILEEGLVIERGMIDGMWEGDPDHEKRIS